MQRSDASPGDITDGKKLVVLINGGSASAAEELSPVHYRITTGQALSAPDPSARARCKLLSRSVPMAR